MAQFSISSYFKIMPEHTNWQPYNEHGNVIFGGCAMSQMDLAAANICTIALNNQNSPCTYAVTWDAEMRFHKPVGSGDLLKIVSTILSVSGKGYNSESIRKEHLQKRSIEVCVEMFVMNRSLQPDLFAVGNFTFITKKGEKYADHELNLKFYGHHETWGEDLPDDHILNRKIY